jgi:hypothetical protein
VQHATCESVYSGSEGCTDMLPCSLGLPSSSLSAGTHPCCSLSWHAPLLLSQLACTLATAGSQHSVLQQLHHQQQQRWQQWSQRRAAPQQQGQRPCHQRWLSAHPQRSLFASPYVATGGGVQQRCSMRHDDDDDGAAAVPRSELQGLAVCAWCHWQSTGSPHSPLSLP